jgi:hypothetical protein
MNCAKSFWRVRLLPAATAGTARAVPTTRTANDLLQFFFLEFNDFGFCVHSELLFL